MYNIYSDYEFAAVGGVLAKDNIIFLKIFIWIIIAYYDLFGISTAKKKSNYIRVLGIKFVFSNTIILL